MERVMRINIKTKGGLYSFLFSGDVGEYFRSGIDLKRFYDRYSDGNRQHQDNISYHPNCSGTK